MHELRRRTVPMIRTAIACMAVLLLAAPARASAASPVSVEAHELNSNGSTGALLPKFTFIVNDDNARDPVDPNPLLRPSIAPTASNSPLIAKGDQDSASLNLPDGRYLISVRSPDHKMWGKHIVLPRDAGTVKVALRDSTAPLGKLRVFVFEDNHFVNSMPDEGEAGLAGFHVTLTESTNSQVIVDYFNHPLCDGDCVTDASGEVTISNLSPANYTAYVTPPDGSDWIQTSTFLGGFGVTVGAEEGSDGTGVPSLATELFLPPDERTANTFGFVHPMSFPSGGTGSVSGVG